MVEPGADVTELPDMFLHAETFYRAIDIIHRHDRAVVAQISLPLMVLTAFASELYFKCIIFVETGKLTKGHYLYDLFQKLSPKSQRRLSELWDRVTAPREETLRKVEKDLGRTIPRDLRGNLIEGSKSFEDLRYLYEREKPKKFLFNLGDLPRPLRMLVLELKPDLVARK